MEVSVTTCGGLDAWTVSATVVQDLSCSLLTSFDPNGVISVNSNVGNDGRSWMWEGPFGFTSDAPALVPFFPGDYTLEASFCGQTFSAIVRGGRARALGACGFTQPRLRIGFHLRCGRHRRGTGRGDSHLDVRGFRHHGAWRSADFQVACFEVDVVDENGCEASEVVWVESVGVPDVDLGPDQFGCAGDAFTLLAPLGCRD